MNTKINHIIDKALRYSARCNTTLWVRGQTLYHGLGLIIRRLRHRYVLLALVVGFVAVACTGNPQSSEPLPLKDSSAQEPTLTVWWEKGFTLEEDEALQRLVDNWQKQTGTPVKLSLYTTDDLAQRAQRALQAGNPPDLMMSHSAEQSLNPRLAWQGKLIDVSEVIEPIKATYPDGVLDAVHFYNNVEKKRSYYALPFSQTAMYIFYWRDLVKQAGFNDRDFPDDWNQYWQTWEQIQNKLRQQGQDIHSLGITLSIGAADADHFFEQTLEAFDAQIVDGDGNLKVDDPAVRQRIQDSLAWITRFYQQGYVPKDSVKWLSPDNNNSLLNRNVVMTPNATLSIPAAVHQDQDTYLNKLGTLELPNKPNGQPMRYVVVDRQIVAFQDAKHQDAAKQFLAYLIKPETLGTYLKTSGRNLPVTKTVWSDSFWTNPKDPHLSVAAKVLTQAQTRPFYSAYHPAYSVVIEKEVWTRAINQIIIDQVSVEQATDEAIEKVKQIFDQWK